MAKYTPGAVVSAVSGSEGGTTFSKNRYGLYFRTRAIPINPSTVYQGLARDAMANASRNWRTLTTTQQDAWRTWAQSNPVYDSLGQQQILSAHTAFCSINALLVQAGATMLDLPVNTAPPDALATLTFTADIGAGDFQIAYTATPTGANKKLIVRAAVVNSAGIRYVKNLYKQVLISAANQASPIDITDDVQDRFGTLQVGQVVHLSCQILDTTSGLLSAAKTAMATVVTT